MATSIRLRGGTTSQHSTFTGAAKEVTVDTDKNTIVVHDGSTAGGFPLVAKDSSGNATFADNEKAIFGAGSDLQIYHNGTQSYIEDAGTGELNFKTNGVAVNVINSAGRNLAQFNNGGGYARLYFDDGSTSAVKLQTGSGGITVTGAVVSDSGNISGELIADSYNETYAALSGTSPAVNCHNGNSFSLVLSGNTTFTFTNPPASGTAYSFSIEIIQNSGASGYTVTWPSSVDWPAATAPTLTATASAKDIFVFTTRDGGTNWYGFTAGQALA